MNSNPNAKVILCYGDSNTWGKTDKKYTRSRYPADVRWTGVLQQMLGEDYYVIEEGLSGRVASSNASYFKSGFYYFEPCLASHAPVDFVIIMLGTNDMQPKYGLTTKDIANTLEKYVEIVKTHQPQSKMLLVSPIHLDNSDPGFKAYYGDDFNDESVSKSKKLATDIKALANKHGCSFFDASTVAKAGEDGLHFDEASHNRLASELCALIN